MPTRFEIGFPASLCGRATGRADALSYWSAPVTGVVLTAILAVAFTACWIAFLVFCRRVVKQTGDSQSRVHAATAVRAFRSSPGGLLSALVKFLGRY